MPLVYKEKGLHSRFDLLNEIHPEACQGVNSIRRVQDCTHWLLNTIITGKGHILLMNYLQITTVDGTIGYDRPSIYHDMS